LLEETHQYEREQAVQMNRAKTQLLKEKALQKEYDQCRSDFISIKKEHHAFQATHQTLSNRLTHASDQAKAEQRR
jgi:hypothetical protein